MVTHQVEKGKVKLYVSYNCKLTFTPQVLFFAGKNNLQYFPAVHLF